MKFEIFQRIANNLTDVEKQQLIDLLVKSLFSDGFDISAPQSDIEIIGKQIASERVSQELSINVTSRLAELNNQSQAEAIEAVPGSRRSGYFVGSLFKYLQVLKLKFYVGA